MDWINEYRDTLMVYVNIVLVIVTLVYVWLTHKMLKQASKANVLNENILQATSKHNALQQISTIMDTFELSLPERSLSNHTSIDSIPSLSKQSCIIVAQLAKHAQPNTPLNQDMTTVFWAITEFFNRLSVAVSIFHEATNSSHVIPSENIIDFFCHQENMKIISDITFLSHMKFHISILARNAAIMSLNINDTEKAILEDLDASFPGMLKISKNIHDDLAAKSTKPKDTV